MLSTFGDNEAKAGSKKDTSSKGKDGTQQSFNTADKLSPAKMDILIQLDHELCYYLSHFNYNSLTAALHEANLKTIEDNIRIKFDLSAEKTIMEGLTEIFGKDKTGKNYLKNIM